MLISQIQYFCNLRVVLTGFILFFLAACTATSPKTENAQTVTAAEAFIQNKDAYNLINSKYSIYDHPTLQGYVQRVGEHLAARSQKQDLVYRFLIIDNEGTETFSLPGGYVFITRGVLTYLNSEEDLAAVIAHEVAHIEMDNNELSVKNDADSNTPAANGKPNSPDADKVINAVQAQFTSEQELEIHRRASHLLAASGYNPQSLLNVMHIFRRYADYEEQVSALVTQKNLLNIYHPVLFLNDDYSEQLKEIISEAQNIPVSGPPRLNREDFLVLIDGITYGKNVEETANGKLYFNDAGFYLEVPKDWKINADVDPILFQTNDQKAALELVVTPTVHRIPLKDLLVKKYSLKNLQEAKAIKAGSVNGYTVVANRGDEVLEEKARLAAFYVQNKTLIFVGTTMEENIFSHKDAIFLKIIHSLKLVAKNKSQQRNLRIKIIKADNNVTFEQLAKKSALKEWRLRLLNQVSAEGEPKPGQLIKTVH